MGIYGFGKKGREGLNMSIPFQILLEEERIIRGDFFPSANLTRGILIICHGFKGFKDWGMFPYAARKIAQEVDVVTFNFSYNGVGENLTEFTELEKFAHNTYTRELEDINSVVTLFSNHEDVKNTLLDQQSAGRGEPVVFHSCEKSGLHAPVAGSSSLPLFLLGHSRGGGVSIIYALDHGTEIAGVTSWNGITNVDLFSPEIKEEMRTKGRSSVQNARTRQELPLDVEILHDIERNKERFDIYSRIRDIQVPLVLIQGTKDALHLREGSERLVKLNQAVNWVQIEEGNHTFNTVHPFKGTTVPLEKAINETLAFIRKKLED
jgi:hypothetical protein